jgi:mRNA-degrading endonuclease RelE of RelBE toxin-antitoxin system
VKTLLTNTFRRASKKLHRNQIAILEEAIRKIGVEPSVGDSKAGDLAGVRVYKFRMLHQQILLAYTYNESRNEVTLLTFSSHENFYDNLKKQQHN